MSDPRLDNTRMEPRQDGIYVWLQRVMVADMAIGLIVAIVGWFAGDRNIVMIGLGLAAIGAALFLFFTMLADKFERTLNRSRPKP